MFYLSEKIKEELYDEVLREVRLSYSSDVTCLKYCFYNGNSGPEFLKSECKFFVYFGKILGMSNLVNEFANSYASFGYFKRRFTFEQKKILFYYYNLAKLRLSFCFLLLLKLWKNSSFSEEIKDFFVTYRNERKKGLEDFQDFINYIYFLGKNKVKVSFNVLKFLNDFGFEFVKTFFSYFTKKEGE